MTTTSSVRPIRDLSGYSIQQQHIAHRMSLSTSTTATYDLAKYSRAYNHLHSEAGHLQWQHFTNPIIRLTMETRKGVDGHLESYRLKIIWMFSAGIDSMDVDQRDVVFEDLDLVSYSSSPPLQAPQGMPLKAVYQDAVVGIRYQHPRVSPLGATPQYRRFQVVFESGDSASAFIESIRYVCPCKANAPPPPRGARAPTSQGRVPVQQSSQMTVMAAPSPARSAARPALRQTISTLSTDEPPPTIRRTNTVLAASSGLSTGAPAWESSHALYPAHTARQESVGSSSRPSSAVAHHSSSPSSSLSSAVSAAVATSTYAAPGLSYLPPAAPPVAPTPAPSLPSRPNIISPACAPQVPPSARPPALAHSLSDDTSLPSSSLPRSSPSGPAPSTHAQAPHLRASSPHLMPPPPVPASMPRLPDAASSPAAAAATSAAAPAPSVAASPTPAAAHARARAQTHTHTPAEPTDGLAITTGPGPTRSGALRALPRDELERLVADVVREDGFADLVRSPCFFSACSPRCLVLIDVCVCVLADARAECDVAREGPGRDRVRRARGRGRDSRVGQALAMACAILPVSTIRAGRAVLRGDAWIIVILPGRERYGGGGYISSSCERYGDTCVLRPCSWARRGDDMGDMYCIGYGRCERGWHDARSREEGKGVQHGERRNGRRDGREGDCRG
ncbi:hypothetical protein BC628DRAFT_809252 [Trametes gibbosa]|nr:hypothetical protein BC628DRAFT_809252 [Trametes gibbosa]